MPFLREIPDRLYVQVNSHTATIAQKAGKYTEADLLGDVIGPWISLNPYFDIGTVGEGVCEKRIQDRKACTTCRMTAELMTID